MKYLALATDYDGTLAKDGRVDEKTLNALVRFRESGRKLILVTGRELNELLEIFPQIQQFHRAIVENGALLYNPRTQETRMLCQPPPVEFIETLQKRGVAPLQVGRAIVATWEPHGKTVQEAIDQMKLPFQVTLNKNAVMVLPNGVTKASGLKEALVDLNLSPQQVVGVGDAENDLALLAGSGLGVAVANAVTELKGQADWVMYGKRGAGVRELIDRLLGSNLPRRHRSRSSREI
ncbi:HAD family phosphatase [Oscillatoriales cyanobacterium LEGE 11467]|uniref:HAD family phosphatase n=1 Tax=Zarconia navalis LEGE 11467 TaxID=1828826 RepID=A0A928VYI7_9CYAN|nr:HAD family hydrolase [Zarconia navalis]MBE9040483.1 HAD family phosphatase [Zarconia navalis LEGE 11467]